ncbi:Uncharacterised protein [Candidatus Norongarragalina meridionalis]|nr:Uncharacterised protein [Candidatus Norongarragalina meridionalis]
MRLFGRRKAPTTLQLHAQAWDALHPEYAKWRRAHGWPNDAYERIGINREVLQAIRTFKPELNSEERKKLARDVIRRSYFSGKGRWKLAAALGTPLLAYATTNPTPEGMAHEILWYPAAVVFLRALLIGSGGRVVPLPRKFMFATPTRKEGHRGIIIHEASHMLTDRTNALTPLASATMRLEELRRSEKRYRTPAFVVKKAEKLDVSKINSGLVNKRWPFAEWFGDLLRPSKTPYVVGTAIGNYAYALGQKLGNQRAADMFIYALSRGHTVYGAKRFAVAYKRAAARLGHEETFKLALQRFGAKEGY